MKNPERKQLTQRQYHELVMELEKIKETTPSVMAKATDDHLALRMSTALGFLVSPITIKGIRRDFEMPQPEKRVSQAQRINNMLGRIENLEADVAKLISIIGAHVQVEDRS